MKNNMLTLIGLAWMMASCTIIHPNLLKGIQSLEFEPDDDNKDYKFIYQDFENSPQLSVLNAQYQLDSIAKVGRSELEQILALLDWTHKRWKHNGSNQPSESNTLTILKEAETGKKFRCVEYGIVLKSILAARGFKARTLGLKTRDVEITRSGAGHVLTEVWSDAFQQWFLLDAQFNIIPMLNNNPLNAVEFQHALVENQDLKLIDMKGEVSQQRQKEYIKFISPYLYYLDFKFDQRELPFDSLYKVNGKAVLMLVPVGAKKPIKFQRETTMDYLIYTNSLKDFYRIPK